MSYIHFTLDERKYLQILLSEKKSLRKIAALLGRSPSSVSREIKRNKPKYKPHRKPDNIYWYNSWRAQNLYIQRRRRQERCCIKPGTLEWNYVVNGLLSAWSPETIRERWAQDHPDRKPLCWSTIYRYVKLKRFPQITAKKNLRRHGKRLMPRNSNYNSIQPDRLIPEWPEEIVQRLRIGDWEGDTVYGGIGKGLIVTFVDRRTRYLVMGLLKERTAEETRLVIEKLLTNMPVKSISLDNGSEFAEFRKLEENLNTLVYFAEPHKPWQRGSNENMNGVIRFFFPKGFDFRTIDDEVVKSVQDLINNRPRKCLNWKTPAEVFEKGVAID